MENEMDIIASMLYVFTLSAIYIVAMEIIDRKLTPKRCDTRDEAT